MAEQQIIIKKKVNKAHAAHHGGSWKVAYADFVTAMMAFFLVMWLTSMSQQDKDMIQGYFNDPLGFADNAPKSRTLMTMEGMPKPKPSQQQTPGQDPYRKEQEKLQRVEEDLNKALKSDKSFQDLIKNVKITMTPEGLLIEFMEAKGAVFFESGSSVIRPEAMKLIEKLSPILARSGYPLVVQGHTDSQPFAGSANGNWGLSTERALSLQTALIGGGVKDPQFAEVSGFADKRPLDPADPLNFSNRRVTILLPRKYTPGSTQAEPADALRNAIGTAANPEAVELKPDAGDVVGRDSR